MKRIFAVCLTAVVAFAPMVFAQDKDGDAGDIDAKIQKALNAADAEAAKTPDTKAPAAKDANDDDDAKIEAQNNKEEAEKTAAVQATVEAKGPAALPPWTPAVPEFSASGPVARKLVDGEARIVLTGTSPLAPDALADAWDAFKGKPNFSHERTGSVINGHADLFVTYRNGEDGTEAKMEVEREAGSKVTHVTVSSPIALPQPSE